MHSVWEQRIATKKRIRVDRNIWKWSDKCNGCRTLGTAININNWWEAGRSQSHYSHWQKSDNRRNRVTTGHQSRYGLIRHTSPSTPFCNWIGKSSSTLPTAQTWPLQISICLDPSGTLSEVVDLQLMMKWKRRCMTGFAVNHKLSFPMALRSLQITGLNASRRKEITLKSNVVLMSVT